MYWGGGHGDRSPSNDAVRVAKAFFAGKPAKGKDCETDGRVFKVRGSVIARRPAPEKDMVYALTHEGRLPAEPHRVSELQWSWSGWPTPMTSRYLNALGVRASVVGRANPILYLNGAVVKQQKWYSEDDLMFLKAWPGPLPKEPKRRKAKFVNITAELFP